MKFDLLDTVILSNIVMLLPIITLHAWLQHAHLQHVVDVWCVCAWKSGRKGTCVCPLQIFGWSHFTISSPNCILPTAITRVITVLEWQILASISMALACGTPLFYNMSDCSVLCANGTRIVKRMYLYFCGHCWYPLTASLSWSQCSATAMYLCVSVSSPCNG